MAVIVRQYTGVLLLRRAVAPFKNFWDLPGGFCDLGEHPEDAGRRELFEETGITLRELTFHGIWMDTYRESSLQPTGPSVRVRSTMNIVYVAKTDLQVVSLQDSEVVEARWFDINALPTAIAFPSSTGTALAKLARGESVFGLNYPDESP